jgi:hypothetical protein
VLLVLPNIFNSHSLFFLFARPTFLFHHHPFLFGCGFPPLLVLVLGLFPFLTLLRITFGAA